MKFPCLVYSNEHALHHSPDSPRDEECFAYAESVAQSGRMHDAEVLESVQAATTVRMRGGKRRSLAGRLPKPKSSWPVSIWSRPAT